MNIQTIHFPRQLEADGLAEKIREALLRRKTKLWQGSTTEVPELILNEALSGALRKARLQRRVRLGLEDIFDKLAAEKKGIDEMRQKTQSPKADRMSRLLLFSNDGAERFYRHIEQTINDHCPRILGCLLDVDGRELGRLIAGSKGAKGAGVKAILVEHKDAVSDVLRALVDGGK
jgi:hypothetical protein